jgi:8-oxo-dGTP diphosphatase
VTKPHPADAVVAVIRRAGRFLFVRGASHGPGGGYWAPVSGKVEPDESQEEAVRREVREELGVEAVAVTKVGELLTADGSYRLHYWRTTIVRGEPRIESDEATALRWLTLEQLRDLHPTFEDDVRVCAAEAPEAGAGPEGREAPP